MSKAVASCLYFLTHHCYRDSHNAGFSKSIGKASERLKLPVSIHIALLSQGKRCKISKENLRVFALEHLCIDPDEEYDVQEDGFRSE